MKESTVSIGAMSTGRRIWSWTAIVISVLVLLLALVGIAGTWVARGVVIETGTAVLTSIEEVAGIGREAVGTVNGVVSEVQAVTSQVESAVDNIAQNVSDQGLIMTLLPPEREQQLRNAAERIGDAVASIVATVNAVRDLLDAIDSIPFVEAPRLDPERVTRMETEVQEFRDGLEQLAADIQQFRDGIAGDISRISNAAGAVTDRLGTTSANLNEVDSSLADVQNRARALRENLATIMTVIAIVITLFLAWVIYGMAALARGHWTTLHQRAPMPVLEAISQSPEPVTKAVTSKVEGDPQDEEGAE